MKLSIKHIALATALVGFFVAAPMAPTASAQISKGLDTAKTDEMGNVTATPESLVGQVINWLLFFVGVVAVIMIIVGGIKYITSAGDTAKVTSAKNTIMYSVIGLVVAIFAWAIVNFVVKQVQ